MKKSDLKTGMRVRLRNGDIYLVIRDIQHVDGHQELAFINNSNFMRGSYYNDELINAFGYSNNYNVMEVYQINEKPKSLLQCNTLNLDNKYLIWKRQEFTDKQKEIFKALKVLGFNWMARDKDNPVIAFDIKPERHSFAWYSAKCKQAELFTNSMQETFDFIKWEDAEPFEIPNE